MFKQKELAGCYQEGFENYRELIRQITKINHKSCIIVTTSEEPREVREVNNSSSICSIKLKGLDLNNSQKILNGIYNNSNNNKIIEFYQGNPYALNLYGKMYKKIFGNSNRNEENIELNEYKLINWISFQYDNLSSKEKQIISYLTLCDRVVQKNHLSQDAEYFLKDSRESLYEGIDSLITRDLICLLENDKIYYKLNNYIFDYVVQLWSKKIANTLFVKENKHNIDDSTETLPIINLDKTSKSISEVRDEIIKVIESELSVSKKIVHIRAIQTSPSSNSC